MEQQLFFKTFLKNVKEVCSITPSSRYIVRRLCKKIDFSGKKVIVECGPGTGPITKALLRRMTPESKLILIETNQQFVNYLSSINDPRLFVFRGSAQDVGKFLSLTREQHADYIISGIPFSLLSEQEKHSLTKNTYNSLKPNGMYLVYQFRDHIKTYIHHYFPKVQSGFELRNIPPLYLYAGKKR